MASKASRVTLHMVASLDGYIARKDGSVDGMDSPDEFAGGDTMDPAFVESFLATIGCYVMGSRTYEAAIGFEARGLGWAYGDKPTFVLTTRDLPRTRESVEFYVGDLARLVNDRLRPGFGHVWIAGGGARNSSGTVSALLTELLAGASFMPPWIPSLPSANWRPASPN
jgi:dihydrofolate reductase